VPVTYTRNMIQAIKKAGGHPKYTEFAGQGHNIWDLTLKTEGVWDWLFAQRQK
jgi:predicted peptidase